MSNDVPVNIEGLEKYIHACQPDQSFFLYRADLSTIMRMISQQIPGELLSKTENERLTQVRHLKAKDRFIAGRSLMRLILADHLKIPAQEIEIHTTEFGKPFQIHSQNLSFNLSHTGDYFALALSYIAEIGVDIETHKPRKNFTSMADQILTSSEKLWFQTLTESEQKAQFYRLWTLKEATLKAQGTGLTLAIDSIGFSQNNLSLEWNDQLGSRNDWEWFSTQEQGLSIAVALKQQ